MIKISVINKLGSVFATIKRKSGNLKPVMLDVAGIMVDAVEENFKTEGGAINHQWPSLSKDRIKQRSREGTWPGKMLQITQGGLANSITPKATSSEAIVSSNKKYAAIHHFGGVINIPAREQVLHFKKYLRGEKKGKTRFSKSGKATYGQKVKSGAYQVKIPARPFMAIPAATIERIKTVILKWLLW
jgi:phage virion morphogenesis protein